MQTLLIFMLKIRLFTWVTFWTICRLQARESISNVKFMKRYLGRAVMTVSQSYYTRRKHSSRMPTTRFSGHHWMSAPGVYLQEGCTFQRGRCTLQGVYLSGGCTHPPQKRTWDQTRHTHAPKRDLGPRHSQPQKDPWSSIPTLPRMDPPPPPRQNDRHLWKHYLPPTSLAGGNYQYIWGLMPFMHSRHFFFVIRRWFMCVLGVSTNKIWAKWEIPQP